MDSIVTTEAKPLSLTERLKIATVKKDPGTVTMPSLSPATEKVQQPAVQKKSSAAWNSSDDFAEEPKKESAGSGIDKTGTAAAGENKTTTTEAPKLTHAVKMASARTAVGMVDFTQKLVLRPVVNHKFKKKFSKEEIERIPDVEEKNKALLNDEDQQLRTKWDKLMKKRDKQMNCIPLTPVEEQDLEKLFYNYFDATQQSLPPAYGLAFGLINTVGKRAIDIFMD